MGAETTMKPVPYNNLEHTTCVTSAITKPSGRYVCHVQDNGYRKGDMLRFAILWNNWMPGKPFGLDQAIGHWGATPRILRSRLWAIREGRNIRPFLLHRRAWGVVKEEQRIIQRWGRINETRLMMWSMITRHAWLLYCFYCR